MFGNILIRPHQTRTIQIGISDSVTANLLAITTSSPVQFSIDRSVPFELSGYLVLNGKVLRAGISTTFQSITLTNLSDNLETAEVNIAVILNSGNEGFSDSLFMLDLLRKQVNYSRSRQDHITCQSRLLKNVGKNFEEDVTLAESVNVVLSRTVSDITILSEELTKQITKNLSEGLAIADAEAMTVELNVEELLMLSEALTLQIEMALTETLTTLDDTTVLYADLVETMTFSDAVTT